MTLSRCKHTGEKLPDNVSCGRTCSNLDQCLPVPTLEAEDRMSQSDDIERVIASLECIYDAIVRGLGEGD